MRSPLNTHLPHLSIEGFLIDQGELFHRPIQPFPFLGEAQNCFMNATEVVIARQDFTYVEGLALLDNLNIAIHHAWIVSNDGQTFDPTWGKPASAYFGVPIEKEFLLTTIEEQDCYGLFDAGYELSRLVAGLEVGFKAATICSPHSEFFRETAKCHWHNLLSNS
jgi:hypothetical protein